MPAKSKAQFRMMFVLRKKGEISQTELDRFTKGVDYKSLPARKKKRKRKKRR
jgi:hypothetical protein